MNGSTLDWAKFYLSKGFSLIPLRSRDKASAKSSWKEYQTKKPTESELEDWFAKGDKNIGIVTGGISGIVVIDLDSEAAEKFAIEKGFPKTPSVKTAKGCHLYYKYPNDIEVRNFQKRDDLPNIDLRANGGYVVAPPSIHSSGSVYEWIEGKGLDDLSLAEFPDGILAKKRGEKTPTKELLAGVPEGKRNESLFRICNSFKHTGSTLEECLSFVVG